MMSKSEYLGKEKMLAKMPYSLASSSIALQLHGEFGLTLNPKP